MGRRILHTGPLGSASILKVVTNYLATANLVSLSEALVTSKMAGMDLSTTYEAIRISSGNSFVHETESQVILNGSRDINFTMDLVSKDIGIFRQVAERAGVPVEIAPKLIEIFQDGEARYGPREWSPNIIRRLEEACGVSIHAPGFPAEMIDDEPEEPGPGSGPERRRSMSTIIANPDLTVGPDQREAWVTSSNRRQGFHNLWRQARYGLFLRSPRVLTLNRRIDRRIGGHARGPAPDGNHLLFRHGGAAPRRACIRGLRARLRSRSSPHGHVHLEDGDEPPDRPPRRGRASRHALTNRRSPAGNRQRLRRRDGPGRHGHEHRQRLRRGLFRSDDDGSRRPWSRHGLATPG